jgi:hypothetical protein
MNRGQTFGEPGANFVVELVVELQRQKRNMALPTVRMPKEQRTSENSVTAKFAFWGFSEVQHRVRLGSTHASLVAFGYHAREARSDLTHECCGEERYTHG